MLGWLCPLAYGYYEEIDGALSIGLYFDFNVFYNRTLI